MSPVAAEQRRRQASEGLIPSFEKLYFRLLEDDNFFETEGVKPVRLGTDYLEDYKQNILAGAQCLPSQYRAAYIEPLCKKHNLRKIVRALMGADRAFPVTDFQWLLEWNLTIMLNAAMQPAQDEKLSDDIRGLWAVGADIYHSFIPAWSRLTAKRSLLNALPPLMAFTYYILRFSPSLSKPAAPCTLDVDVLANISKRLKLENPFKVGVVSMPSGFRDHPIFWGILAHEVGGHNVLHTDDDTLLDELNKKIRLTVREVAGDVSPEHTNALEQIWQEWAEEAASDVCAVLNLGPFYGLGILLYYTTMYHLWLYPKDHASLARHTHGPLLENKAVQIKSGQEVLWVDRTHPIPILLPHLVIGAVEELIGLDSTVKERYLNQIRSLANVCEGGQTTVDLSALNQDGPRGRATPLSNKFPLKPMQEIAYQVGKCIAGAPLEKALKGRRLCDLETWDDQDEEAAQDVANMLDKGKELDGLKCRNGKEIDAAQLLAGAIFTAVRGRADYDRLNQNLKKALVDNYERDPLVGKR
jgi:hypothetical protein